jgi:hypothetical protein
LPATERKCELADFSKRLPISQVPLLRQHGFPKSFIIIAYSAIQFQSY